MSHRVYYFLTESAGSVSYFDAYAAIPSLNCEYEKEASLPTQTKNLNSNL